MVIIEDTRQKSGQHELKHQCFEDMNVTLVRNMLPFGDYALPPSVTVDTKANMLEIAHNIGTDHKRFKRECIAAKEAGCQLIVLIENEEGIETINDVHTWINPEVIYRPRAITGERLEKAMKTMNERYGVRFEFCKPQDAAGRIIELFGVWECQTDL